MKKAVILLATVFAVSLAVEAQPKIRTIKDAYIFGQSCRTAKKQGSVLSLTTGIAYSLEMAITETSPRDIDILLFFGKVRGAKVNSFNISALDNPNVDINWEKEGGTTPFCKFEGPSSDPNGRMALKNWTIRNATKLQRVEDEIDFNKVTPEEIAALEVDEYYNVAEIKAGDIIKFETASGKKGLIIIKKISDDPEVLAKDPARAGREAYQRIDLDIKIQR